MVLRFLAGLSLLNLSFWILVMVVDLPIVVGLGFLTRDGNDRHRVWSAIFNNAVTAVVFSGCMATATSIYVSAQPRIEHFWFYGVCGFLLTSYVLFEAAKFERRRARDPGYWLYRPSGEQEEEADAAGVAAFAGVLAWPVLYNWPGILTVVPGAVSFFTYVIRFANWLSGFWVVQLLLALVLLGYIVNVGFVALIGSTALFWVAFGTCKRLLTRTPGHTVSKLTTSIPQDKNPPADSESPRAEVQEVAPSPSREVRARGFKVEDRRTFNPDGSRRG